MRKYLAEFLGTFMLVFLGTATVVIAKGDVLAIGLAFGLAITVSAYAFGGISGGHFNPAVTTAMLINLESMPPMPLAISSPKSLGPSLLPQQLSRLSVH